METLNLAEARRRLGDDESLLKDLAGFYIEDVPPLLQQAVAALEQRDADELRRSAHSIKGLSLNFDAESASEVARTIEQHARAGEFEEAARLLPQLRAEVERVCAALRTAGLV